MTQFNTVDEALAVLKNYPPVEWEEFYGKHTIAEMVDLTRQLEAISEQAARLVGYLDARSFGAGHATGVKRSNSVGAGARRTLGYQRSDINF